MLDSYGWPYNAKDVEATVQAMKIFAKKPQLPHRLRCTEIVPNWFAGALGRLISYTWANNDPTIHINTYANGETSKVPLACAELYLAWVQPTGKGSVHRPGPLVGLSQETLAKLAVDVFLEELQAWRSRVPQPKMLVFNSIGHFGSSKSNL